MKFEDTGLPDKQDYRNAFDKALRNLKNAHECTTSDSEIDVAYRHLFVVPAALICDLKLPEKNEKELVTLVLGGKSAFNFMASKKLQKLRDALQAGYTAWSGDTEGYKKMSDDMTKEERLMLQLGIFSCLQTAVDLSKEYQGGQIAVACENARTLMNVYDAVSRGEFPLVDRRAKEGYESLKALAKKNGPAPSSPQP